MKTIYMDHASTTAMSKDALEEMLPYFSEEYGNPSAVYSYGQTGKNVIERKHNEENSMKINKSADMITQVDHIRGFFVKIYELIQY